MTLLEAPADRLTIAGRTGRTVRFASPLLLAPMDGVTDSTFRAVVLDLGHAGGATTEFIRVSQTAVPARVIRRDLGPLRTDVPVAVQIMASGPEHLEESVVNAERAGASWIDLNFGCPVPRVCGKGAGSALLGDPPLLARIVETAVRATELPVSAKIRAGLDDASRLAEVVDAVAGAGASMLTVHARRRVDSYAAQARWEWIAAAREHWRARATGPLCGNGSVTSAADATRMLAETGCDLVMIGRGAIANPFVFREYAGAPPATPSEAAQFALRYADAIQPDTEARHRLGRIKQLVRFYRAGGLFEGREDERLRLMRAGDAGTLRAFFAAFITTPAQSR